MEKIYSRTCDPVYGFPPPFTSADLPRSFEGKPQEVLHEVVATTLSQPLNLGARGVKIVVTFQNSNGVCDLELYEDGNATPVKTWQGVTRENQPLIAGNLDFIDLEGKSVQVKAVNPQNGWVTVGILRQY